jgi:hypothetical protein
MSEEHPRLMTPEALLGPFPNIFERGLANDSGVQYFEANLLFSPEAQKTPAFAALKKAASEACKEKWPTGVPSNLRSPFRPATEKVRQKDGIQYFPSPTFDGWILLAVKSKNQPGVVNAQVQKIIDPSEIYGGITVKVTAHPFAYSAKGNNGVSFWMNNMQVVRGAPADSPYTKALAGGGGRPAEDDFSPVGDGANEGVDALFDTEIPF